MSTDIRVSQAQIPKIIKSGRFLGKKLSKLCKRILLSLGVPLVRDVLPKLATKASSSVLDRFEIKNNWTRSSQCRKKIDFICLNADMDDIIKIVESLEKWSVCYKS